MVRSSAISIVAASAAAYGSYNAVQTFVPGLAGISRSPDAMSNLRGASAVSAPSSSSTATGVMVAGVLSLGAVARSSVIKRHATATLERTTEEKEEAPAPPQFQPSEQIGASAPLGFFDPLGFSKVGDEEGFRKLRIAELKHGRVAMMASVGAVVQHYVQFGGYEKVPKGIFAITDGTGLFGFAQLFVLSGVLELVLWKEKENGSVSSVGDYGNPAQMGQGTPLGLSPEMKARELENGRAAMIATSGIVLAELLTGKDGIQQLGWS